MKTAAAQCSYKTRFFQAMAENTEIFCALSLLQIICTSVVRLQRLRSMYYKDNYADVYTRSENERTFLPYKPWAEAHYTYE